MDGITAIFQLSKLRKLQISFCGLSPDIDANSIAQISNLCLLEVLEMANFVVNEEVFRSICQLSQLKRLVITDVRDFVHMCV